MPLPLRLLARDYRLDSACRDVASRGMREYNHKNVNDKGMDRIVAIHRLHSLSPLIIRLVIIPR